LDYSFSTHWIKETFSIEYQESKIYKIVEKLNNSKTRPRKRDKRAKQEILEEFKVKLSDTIKKKLPILLFFTRMKPL
jgi:hypothetical protein